MPLLSDAVFGNKIDVPGIRWHAPSQQFIAEIGNHEVKIIGDDGSVRIRRVRTTFYLGKSNSRSDYVSKFNSLKADWKGWVGEERKRYDAEQARRRSLGQPPMGRFKPCWPKNVVRTPTASRSPSIATPLLTAKPVASTPPPIQIGAIPAFAADDAAKRAEVVNLTIKQAVERYTAQQKLRIGLLNGKGINENTYEKHIQMLTLGLALNPTYSRPSRPIDVNKRLGDLVAGDYETFVQFWCNPNHLKSDRAAANYVHAFSRMIRRLKVPTPDAFDDIFKIKLLQPPKIARYDPDVLRSFLQHPHERVRMLSMMFLNFGYYQVDVTRLEFQHITDFEGNPYKTGEMFITKRRERTRHQNAFTTTIYAWPETQRLMERQRAPLQNPWGRYLVSKQGTPYKGKTVSGLVEQVIREKGLNRQLSVKQFRKIGASQIKKLAGSDAMHQYKANALGAADQPYILEDFTLLTKSLKAFREKLIVDGVIIPDGEA